MQVGTAGVAGGADPADDLSGGDLLTGCDVECGRVTVAGDGAVAVVDVDLVW